MTDVGRRQSSGKRHDAMHSLGAQGRCVFKKRDSDFAYPVMSECWKLD